MKSNEGIYSLGLKSSSKRASRAAPAGGTSSWRTFSYDSDDADDELVHPTHGDNVPSRDSWLDWERLSHTSWCSWDKMKEGEAGRRSSGGLKAPPGADSKERPEVLLSFINSFLPEGQRTPALTKSSRLHCRPPGPGPEELAPEAAGPPLDQRWLQREQSSRSADKRTSLLQEPRGARSNQLEEKLIATMEAEREWPDLAPTVPYLAPKVPDLPQVPDLGPKVPETYCQGSKVVCGDPDLVSEDRPTRQKSRASRTITVLEAPESWSETISQVLRPQRNQLRGPRTSRGLPRPESSKLLRSPGWSSLHPGAAAANVSTEVKIPGSSSHGSKVSSLSGRVELRSSFSCSPLLPKSQLNYTNHREPPTRDQPPPREQHCESRNHLRAPSPPHPPGRSTSLLVRPNYESRPRPPSFHTLRRIPPEDHLSSAPSGRPLDPDYAPRASKNVPTPYGDLHPSSNPHPAAGRRTNDNALLTVDTPPVSLAQTPPVSLGPQGQAESQTGSGVSSTPSSLLGSPSAKTRLPGRFRALLKPPPNERTPPCVAAKQEKDQINSVSKLTGANANGTERRGDVQRRREVQTRLLHHVQKPEDVCEQRRSGLLVSTCSTRAQLKPALGMNGAKARSQNFSSTQGPVHPPRSRVTLYKGVSSIRPHLLPERVQASSEASSPSSTQQKNSPGQVGQAPPAPSGVLCPQKPGDVPQDQETGPGPDVKQRRSKRSACTIEEKVMMGIKEKAQRCQDQGKMSQSRQKTAPSLSNWFGLRRSKLPALRNKEEKELKTLSGKTKEKQKSEQQMEGEDGQKLSEMNDKLSSIMEHCNNHMEQLANHIQASTALRAKEQLVRELLGR